MMKPCKWREHHKNDRYKCTCPHVIKQTEYIHPSTCDKCIYDEGPNMKTFTIGMATYNDFDGVYFTVQALNMYQDMTNTDIIVIDNYGCESTKQFIENWVKNAKYILHTNNTGTSASRNMLFKESTSDFVLCIDCHVMLWPNSLKKLRNYFEATDTNNLIQGPLVNDDLTTLSTHFEPVWRNHMYGIWGTDQRGYDENNEPFEIPMQGLGLFGCKREAWQNFNPMFTGFGGEEGYIHEKFRQAGYKCLCAPWLKWVHRFQRPKGVPYPLKIEDRIRNYFIGHEELGLDLKPIITHFTEAGVTTNQLKSIMLQCIGQEEVNKYFE